MLRVKIGTTDTFTFTFTVEVTEMKTNMKIRQECGSEGRCQLSNLIPSTHLQLYMMRKIITTLWCILYKLIKNVLMSKI